MRTFLFIVLFLAVLVSACTSSGPSKTKVESKDLVEIKKLDVFPGLTVKPEDVIQVRFEVENVGQVPVDIDVGDLSRGEKVLYDYCPYIFTSVDSMQILGSYDVNPAVGSSEEKEIVPDDFIGPLAPNQIRASEAQGVNEAQARSIKLQPGRSVIFQWELEAPSADRLLGLNTECVLGTKITYRADAKTATYVYFASPAEISQKVYTGEDLSQKGDNIASHGPVVVNVETPPQPITASTDKQPRSWTLFVNVKNLGKGIASVSELNVSLPEAIQLPRGDCKLESVPEKDRLLTINNTGEDKSLLKIGLQSTSKMPCRFSAPIVSILEPFFFESNATYEYSLFKQTKLTVNTK